MNTRTSRKSLRGLLIKFFVVAAVLLGLGIALLQVVRRPEPTTTTTRNALSASELPASWFPSAGLPMAHAADAQQATLPDIAAAATRSVVSVSSRRQVASSGHPLFGHPELRQFFGLPPGREEAPRQAQGLGSGVIVSADGTVLTNHHVIEGADEVRVVLPSEEEVIAKVVGSDPQTDLAVLELTDFEGELTPLEMGDSNALRPGAIVLAVGNPFGIGQTVTMGIVSAVRRTGMGIVDYEDFIQTDAAINPGNSGGALVDMTGRLIGINTAILSRSGGYQGIGFAIPTSMVRPVMSSLLETGEVVRGWLGVVIQDIDDDLRQALELDSSKGVLLSEVMDGSPAERAGLQRGDVVVELNGKPVEGTNRFRSRIASISPGTEATFGIRRGGEQREIEVTLGKMPGTSRAASGHGESLGMQLAPLTPRARAALEVPARIAQGVVVQQVQPESAAARAGLRPGDVVIEVSRKPVSSPQELQASLARAKGVVPILVYRDGTTLFLTWKRTGQK